MNYHFIVQKNGYLKPSNKHTFEAMLKYGENAFIRAEFKTERNPLHSAKYWALMECVYQHICDKHRFITNKAVLSHVIQYLLAKDGHKVAGEFIPLKDDHYFERASLSFGSMPQEKFSEYYDLAINKAVEIMKAVGLEVSREELEQNSEYYGE